MQNVLVQGKLDTNRAFPQEVYADANGNMHVTTNNSVSEWRTSFTNVLASSVDSTYWTQLGSASGMTVAQASGNLTVAAGTTTNSEVILRSKTSFAGYNMRLMVQNILSQRNANQSFFIELVDVIGDGLAMSNTSATSVTVTFPTGTNPFAATNVGQKIDIGALSGIAGAVPMQATIASTSGDTVTLTVAGWPGAGTGTCSLFGWNYHRLEFTGATATSVNYDCQRNGWQNGNTATTINTTASPGTIMVMGVEDALTYVGDMLSAAGSTYTPRTSKNTNVPASSTTFYLQLRVKNGTAAPTATTWTVGFVSMQTYDNMPVSMQNVRPQSQVGAAPVNVTNTSLVAIGTAAEDAAATTSPVTVGGAVRTATSPTTLVAGDSARLTMTSGAALVVKDFAVPETDWSFASAVTGIATGSDTAAKAAGAAGIRNYVTAIQIQNNSATASEFQIKDGASTVLWRCLCPANMPVTSILFPTPLRGTAATALNVQAVTAASVVITNVQGYQSA